MIVMNAPNRLHLYSKPAEAPLAEGQRPPLCIEQLVRRDLQGAAILAALAFSAHKLPRICWDESRGWLELPLQLISPMFVGAQDFLDALPSIQRWIDAWSGSADRAPDLTPDWATTRDAGPETVRHFSQGLEKRLSKTTTRSIEFCDGGGRPVFLNIPATAALTLPPASPNDGAELQVVSKERALKFALRTGRAVIIPMVDKCGEIEIGSELLHVDPRRLRSREVIHVKRMRALSIAVKNGR